MIRLCLLLFATIASAKKPSDHVHGVHFEDEKMHYHGIAQSYKAMMLLHALSANQAGSSQSGANQAGNFTIAGNSKSALSDIIAPSSTDVAADEQKYGGPIEALGMLKKILNLMPDEIAQMTEYQLARGLLNDYMMRLDAYGYVAYTQNGGYEHIMRTYFSHHLPTLYGWLNELNMLEGPQPGTDAYIRLQQKFSSLHWFLYRFRTEVLLSPFQEWEHDAPRVARAGQMEAIHAMDLHVAIDQQIPDQAVDDAYINSVYTQIESLIKQTLHAQRDYNTAYEKYEHYRMAVCTTVGNERNEAMAKAAKAMHVLLKAQEDLYNHFMMAKKYEHVLRECSLYLLKRQLACEQVREMKFHNGLTAALTDKEEEKLKQMKYMCEFFQAMGKFSDNANIGQFLIGHHELRADLIASYECVKKLNSDIQSGVRVCPENTTYAALDESILDMEKLDAKHLSLVEHSSQFLETAHKALGQLKPLEKLSSTVPPGTSTTYPYGAAEYTGLPGRCSQPVWGQVVDARRPVVVY